jgi:ferritin-like protein
MLSEGNAQGEKMASDNYHEPIELLRPETIDMHRAVRSLMEELEAIDWYQQRVDATADAELKRILGHNRDEEIEHAVMTLEWIRRRSPTFDRVLRTYLFQEGDIIAAEAGSNGDAPRATIVGSLKGVGK